MISGILAGMMWAMETIVLGIAMAMTPFVSNEQAIALAPFVSTFIHDFFSAIWSLAYNGIRGNLKNVIKAIHTRNGKSIILAAVIGGPVGMTGYVLSINNMGHPLMQWQAPFILHRCCSGLLFLKGKNAMV